MTMKLTTKSEKWWTLPVKEDNYQLMKIATSWVGSPPNEEFNNHEVNECEVNYQKWRTLPVTEDNYQ